MIPAWFRMPCLFQMMTGLYCPGCGGTRAVRALLSGHPVLSFLYHPVVPYMASVAVWAAASWILYFATGNGYRKWYLFWVFFVSCHNFAADMPCFV